MHNRLLNAFTVWRRPRASSIVCSVPAYTAALNDEYTRQWQRMCVQQPLIHCVSATYPTLYRVSVIHTFQLGYFSFIVAFAGSPYTDKGIARVNGTHRARIVPRWLVFGGYNIMYTHTIYVLDRPSRPTQSRPSLLSVVGANSTLTIIFATVREERRFMGMAQRLVACVLVNSDRCQLYDTLESGSRPRS